MASSSATWSSTEKASTVRWNAAATLGASRGCSAAQRSRTPTAWCGASRGCQLGSSEQVSRMRWQMAAVSGVVSASCSISRAYVQSS